MKLKPDFPSSDVHIVVYGFKPRSLPSGFEQIALREKDLTTVQKCFPLMCQTGMSHKKMLRAFSLIRGVSSADIKINRELRVLLFIHTVLLILLSTTAGALQVFFASFNKSGGVV